MEKIIPKINEIIKINSLDIISISSSKIQRLLKIKTEAISNIISADISFTFINFKYSNLHPHKELHL